MLYYTILLFYNLILNLFLHAISILTAARRRCKKPIAMVEIGFDHSSSFLSLYPSYTIKYVNYVT